MSVRAMKSFLFALLLIATGAAQATITVYTSKAAFLAAISAPGTDTFNDLPLASIPSPLLGRTAGPYGYTAAVSTTSFFTAGTAADVWLSTNTATDTVTINALPANVRGIGGYFFGSDISGNFAAGNITLTATDGNGTVTQTIVGATTTSFMGFVSNGPLTSMTITSVQPGSGFLWPTANDLVMGLAAGPGPATHFTVSAPASATTATPFSFTVTARDAANAVATGYSGTVHFTSTDGTAVLPANSTLVNGVGTFSATLNFAGNQTITATDTVSGSINGTSGTIAVTAPPPVLLGASLRKVHGAAGTFDLPLSLNPTAPSTESRTGPTHTVVFSFDKHIVGGTITAPSEGTATPVLINNPGNDVTGDYSGVTDKQYVTFVLAGIVSADGGTLPSVSVRVGFLFGDVNQTRQVTVADVGIVNGSLLQPVSISNFFRDVNVDGKITVADKGLTNSVLLNKLPAP